MVKHRFNLSTLKDLVLTLAGILLLAVVLIHQVDGLPSIFGTALENLRVVQAAPAAQAPAGEQPASLEAPQSDTWVSCTPIGIQVYPAYGRLHVRCSQSYSGVSFFALSTKNSAEAARVLSVITSAQVAGRTLSILYDPADTSGSAIGCQVADCRLIKSVGFGQ